MGRMKIHSKEAVQKRNKIKSKVDTHEQTVIVMDDEEIELKIKLKKKKKKHLKKEKAAEEITTKKKKDSKLRKGMNVMENMAKEAIQKRKKIKSTVDTGEPTVIVMDDEEIEPKVKLKKKKKKHLEKEKAAEEITTKKKHSKVRKGCADYLPGIESSSDLRSLKVEEITKDSSLDSESIKDTGKIFKKKKSQGEHGGTWEVPNEDQSEVYEELQSFSGKRSKRSVLENHGDDQEFAPKKKKKRHRPSCEDSNMKKKIEAEKETAKDEEEEIQVVAIKEGNCDEIGINMLRRKALQDEIDQESGKTKAAEEEGESNAHFGQWSTATFESSERKNKFLRLLGSFKNGSASTSNSPAHTTRPNMALAWTGEKRLLQNLQAEFDKARDLKQVRGVGLGFQSTAPKRLYIDKNASKSIKFEN